MTGEAPMVQEALPIYLAQPPEAPPVPRGYKQSEVSVIPEDWEVRPLLSLVSLPTGQVDPRVEPYRSMVLVAPDHVESRTGRLLKKSIASDQGAISGKYIFGPGDIVYSKIRPYLQKAILADFQGLCSADMYPLASAENIAPGFVFAVLLGYRFSCFAENVSARSGIPKINREELAGYAVALPPLDEQRAIAAALSDVDALISGLDKLIAKKRALKTAAMQQLLTGKQRLPGFSGEWEMKRLGDTCQIVSGGTPSTSVPAFWTGDIPWCTPTDITENNAKYLFGTNRTISKDGLKQSSAVLLLPGALLLCTRATVGEIKIAAMPVCTNQGFKSLVCGPNVSNEFIFYKLVTLKDRLRELGVGSTFLEVSRKDVAALEIPLPGIQEQTAIAAVLSDMDAEVSALEARRDKTRQLKRGMMQELLTGRTRLV